MKKQLAFLLLTILSICVKAQPGKYDTSAIMLLDHMCHVIGELTSCTFTVHTATDRLDPEKGLVVQFSKSEICFSGHDKMQINFRGPRGQRGFWYNGQQLDYYFYDENNYASIATPATTLEMIDSVNKTYGIDFPATDFFYPSFTDDLVSSSDMISYLGKSDIDEKECFHIMAKNKDMNIQIWVTNDGMMLPAKMIINYLAANNETQRYEATYSKWQINPELPDAMFEFIPPANANAVHLLSKKSN